MDKLLAHIDIAQEDGTQNPSAAHSRIKAKTNGQLVSRSPAGVESALGGGLQLISSMLNSNFDAPSDAITVVPNLFVDIPPGKTANLVMTLCIRGTANASLANNYTAGFRLQNPIGANAAVGGAYSIKVYPSASGAAGAAALFDGDVINIAANANLDILPTNSITATGQPSVYPVLARAQIINNSTTTSCRFQAALFTTTNNVADIAVAGSAIFAIIS